ncbi:hypothetical protein SAMN04488503_2276 [Humidesulfovibrio mexicanus]|uniref:Uncharacterized protein n=1 Tax=Humidesulfovibrio mexicanus TaxID=147047 RepID=A0A239AWM8_9BACT|nr:hypothetical protein [Humidesulfovibrio mexicanus]SNS00105.1 hypothetical protein SAMN04488503_2276 [Humidesulfovibrio mexicanus]
MRHENIERAERIAKIIDGYPDRPADPSVAVPEGITEEEINDTLTDCFHLTELQDQRGSRLVEEVRVSMDGWDFTIPRGVAMTLRCALDNYTIERANEGRRLADEEG